MSTQIELDKAVELFPCPFCGSKPRATIHPDTRIPYWIDCERCRFGTSYKLWNNQITAKRLKEVEKERDTIINRTPEAIHILLESQAEELSTLRTEYEFVKQERDLILSKTDTMDLDHKRMLGMSLEMDKLRTEYKNALTTLQDIDEELCGGGIVREDSIMHSRIKTQISTPYAIAAMKGGS